MNLSEIQEHIELYTNRAKNAHSPEEKQMFTNMVKVWTDMKGKTFAKELDRRTERLRKNVEKLDIEFSAWEEWAHSLYDIKKHANGYTVKSHARNWLNEVVWEVDSDLGAMEKVYQLIKYKIADRKRGQGDILKDLGLPINER